MIACAAFLKAYNLLLSTFVWRATLSVIGIRSTLQYNTLVIFFLANLEY